MLATFVAVIVAVIPVGALAHVGGAITADACRIGQMRLKIGPLVSEKTEQHTATVTLTNLGSASCTLDGYPVIALLDSRGRILPFIYSRRGDQMITSARPEPLHLQAGASAFFAFNKNACVSFTNRYARTLRVTLPGSRASRSIQLPRYPIIDYCQGNDPGATVTVSPIGRTRAEAFCQSQGACRRGRSG